jgi:hypothetical protein
VDFKGKIGDEFQKESRCVQRRNPEGILRGFENEFSKEVWGKLIKRFKRRYFRRSLGSSEKRSEYSLKEIETELERD